MPWDAGSKDFRLDDELLAALGSILADDLGEATRSRIFRTIEWFRLAHTGSTETSDESRLFMMSTAFETLLGPENAHDKSGPIAVKLHELTNDDYFATTTVKIGSKAYAVNTLAAWFCSFYSLRNRVIHGDGLTSEDFTFNDRATQLDVADLVLWEAISWELINSKLLGQKAREYAEWFSQLWSNQSPSPHSPAKSWVA